MRASGRCAFRACSGGGPFVYIVTSVRNRGVALNRLLRTLAADIAASDNATHPLGACVCLAVADFDDPPRLSVPVAEALTDWPHDAVVLSVPGSFGRTAGFQACLDSDAVVTTPRNDSVAFFVDADMVVFPGMLRALLTYTEHGQAFAPVVWSTSGHVDNEYTGWWRDKGCGMLSVYLSDLDRIAGKVLPLADRTLWGMEDVGTSTVCCLHAL